MCKWFMHNIDPAVVNDNLFKCPPLQCLTLRIESETNLCDFKVILGTGAIFLKSFLHFLGRIFSSRSSLLVEFFQNLNQTKEGILDCFLVSSEQLIMLSIKYYVSLEICYGYSGLLFYTCKRIYIS